MNLMCVSADDMRLARFNAPSASAAAYDTALLAEAATVGLHTQLTIAAWDPSIPPVPALTDDDATLWKDFDSETTASFARSAVRALSRRACLMDGDHAEPSCVGNHCARGAGSGSAE